MPLSSTVAMPRMRLPKAADIVADHIRDRIVRGDLHEGDLLPPESTLMAELGVSRPTLREAYRVLESEELITVRRGSRGGARVHLPTEEVTVKHASLVLELRGTSDVDIFEARAMIEAPVAGMIAAKAKRADVKALRAMIEREREATSDSFAEVVAVNDFHRLLIDMTGNQTLAFVTNVIQGLVSKTAEDFARRGWAQPERRLMAQLHEDHVRLVDLIEAHDVEGAESLWHGHLIRGAAHATSQLNGSKRTGATSGRRSNGATR
jgi:DNA-binding FadR family transcriptional regulator